MLKLRIDTSALARKIKEVGFDDPALRSQLEELVTDLREATPVDTGEARDSWELKVSSDKEATIVNSAEHIQYLNNGTSTQAPKHFIEQVVLNKFPKFRGPIVKVDK